MLKGGEEFEHSPFRTYQLVCRRGGFQAVTNRKEWPQISGEVNCKDPQRIKGFYLRYLLPFEKRNYFGSEPEDDLPALILGAPRKIAKNDSPQKPKNEEYTNLQNEIARTL